MECLVLFGSQTGNSEQTADNIAAHINANSSKFSHCTSRSMQLDDFLEAEQCYWPELVVIVVSSYGVGQAPIGAYKFRELVDEKASITKNQKILSPVRYFMLGLGDSKYTTFFKNPTQINEGMLNFGARRIGELGKADASDNQALAIKLWCENVCYPGLEKECKKIGGKNDELKLAQKAVWSMCRSLWPEELAGIGRDCREQLWRRSSPNRSV